MFKNCDCKFDMTLHTQWSHLVQVVKNGRNDLKFWLVGFSLVGHQHEFRFLENIKKKSGFGVIFF